MRKVERPGIKAEDVRAVIIKHLPFHLHCAPREELRGLKRGAFLLKEEYDDSSYEFCAGCGELI